VVRRERTAKTVTLDLLANLDPAVIPEKTEQLVPPDLQDLPVLTANVVPLALLVLVASRVCLVLLVHLEIQAKTASLVCRDLLGYLVQVDHEVNVVSQVSVVLLVPLAHPVSEDLLV